MPDQTHVTVMLYRAQPRKAGGHEFQPKLNILPMERWKQLAEMPDVKLLLKKGENEGLYVCGRRTDVIVTNHNSKILRGPDGVEFKQGENTMQGEHWMHLRQDEGIQLLVSMGTREGLVAALPPRPVRKKKMKSKRIPAPKPATSLEG